MNILDIDCIFWLYRSKRRADSHVPVYMRITVGDSKKEIATGIFIKEKDWDIKRRRVGRGSLTYSAPHHLVLPI